MYSRTFAETTQIDREGRQPPRLTEKISCNWSVCNHRHRLGWKRNNFRETTKLFWQLHYVCKIVTKWVDTIIFPANTSKRRYATRPLPKYYCCLCDVSVSASADLVCGVGSAVKFTLSFSQWVRQTAELLPLSLLHFTPNYRKWIKYQKWLHKHVTVLEYLRPKFCLFCFSLHAPVCCYFAWFPNSADSYRGRNNGEEPKRWSCSSWFCLLLFPVSKNVLTKAT